LVSARLFSAPYNNKYCFQAEDEDEVTDDKEATATSLSDRKLEDEVTENEDTECIGELSLPSYR
jgi:uncharacterized sporulation protein YeaH/YhbH (DUF444 family)